MHKRRRSEPVKLGVSDPFDTPTGNDGLGDTLGEWLKKRSRKGEDSEAEYWLVAPVNLDAGEALMLGANEELRVPAVSSKDDRIHPPSNSSSRVVSTSSSACRPPLSKPGYTWNILIGEKRARLLDDENQPKGSLICLDPKTGERRYGDSYEPGDILHFSKYKDLNERIVAKVQETYNRQRAASRADVVDLNESLSNSVQEPSARTGASHDLGSSSATGQRGGGPPSWNAEIEQRLEDGLLEAWDTFASRRELSRMEVDPERIETLDVVRAFLNKERVVGDDHPDWSWDKLVKKVEIMKRRQLNMDMHVSTPAGGQIRRRQSTERASSSRTLSIEERSRDILNYPSTQDEPQHRDLTTAAELRFAGSASAETADDLSNSINGSLKFECEDALLALLTSKLPKRYEVYLTRKRKEAEEAELDNVDENEARLRSETPRLASRWSSGEDTRFLASPPELRRAPQPLDNQLKPHHVSLRHGSDGRYWSYESEAEQEDPQEHYKLPDSRKDSPSEQPKQVEHNHQHQHGQPETHRDRHEQPPLIGMRDEGREKSNQQNPEPQEPQEQQESEAHKEPHVLPDERDHEQERRTFARFPWSPLKSFPSARKCLLTVFVVILVLFLASLLNANIELSVNSLEGSETTSFVGLCLFDFCVHRRKPEDLQAPKRMDEIEKKLAILQHDMEIGKIAAERASRHDYGLDSNGATAHPALSYPRCSWNLFGSRCSHSLVTTPEVQRDHCWSFKGHTGYLTISFRECIRLQELFIERSPDTCGKHALDAPNEVDIWAALGRSKPFAARTRSRWRYDTEQRPFAEPPMHDDDKFFHLGSFQYNHTSPDRRQYFSLSDQGLYVRRSVVKIVSNHGAKSTSLCHLGVHGVPFAGRNDEA